MTVTNQEIADTFRAVKARLWNGKPGGRGYDKICFALGEVVSRNECSREAFIAARDVIYGRLDSKHNNIEAWLLHVAKIPYKLLTYEATQTYRHEWLDHLIEEFSK